LKRDHVAITLGVADDRHGRSLRAVAEHSESPPAAQAAEHAPDSGSGQSPDRHGLHLNVSPFLLSSVVAAAATTVALIVIVALDARPPAVPPPPPGSGSGPARLIPPPSFAPLLVVSALFIVSWLAVLLAICRDRIIQRLGAVEEAARSDIASLRRQLTEYGDGRETEGYLYGLRSAQQNRPARLHPLPPPDQT
jgi:hypothetical protein